MRRGVTGSGWRGGCRLAASRYTSSTRQASPCRSRWSWDLAIYAQHILFHAVPVLWRLHRMHHADPEFDVSTGVRFHPFEILLSMLIKCGAVIVLGVPPLAVLALEVLLNASSMFSHGNVPLPGRLDGLLRLLVPLVIDSDRFL